VPIVARRAMMLLIHATNVKALCIATPLAKRNTDQNIKSNVREE
jgi:hypothetical protein